LVLDEFITNFPVSKSVVVIVIVVVVVVAVVIVVVAVAVVVLIRRLIVDRMASACSPTISYVGLRNLLVEHFNQIKEYDMNDGT